MGQTDVLELLRRRKKLMTAKDIANTLDCTHSSLNKQLNQLVKFGEIAKIPKKVKVGTYHRRINHFKVRR